MAAPAVAFVGLGRMGWPMAARMAQRSPVLVRSGRQSRAAEHAAQHGTRQLSEWAAAQDAGAVVTCLPTSAEVAEVAEALLPHLSPGALFVDCTSGCPDATLRIAARLGERGVRMVDAPLSGGPRGAEAGTLSVIAGGGDDDVARCRELLQPVCGNFEHVGPLSAAHAVKAVNNAMASAAMLSACEGIGALQRRGVDPLRALAAINASSGGSWSARELVPKRVVTGTLDHGFSLRLMRKDVRIALGLAPQMPFAALAERGLQAAIDADGEEADLSVAGKLARDAAAAAEGFDWAGVRVTHSADLKRPLLVASAKRGFLACSYISIPTADRLGEACALVTGVSTPRQMLDARLVGVSQAAAELGVAEGMTGLEALEIFRAG